MKDTTAIIAVIDALADSRTRHEPFKSPHEGVAVLLAAATQLNFSIASETNVQNQRVLAVTLAEASLRFLMDVVPENTDVVPEKEDWTQEYCSTEVHKEVTAPSPVEDWDPDCNGCVDLDVHLSEQSLKGYFLVGCKSGKFPHYGDHIKRPLRCRRKLRTAFPDIDPVVKAQRESRQLPKAVRMFTGAQVFEALDGCLNIEAARRLFKDWN